MIPNPDQPRTNRASLWILALTLVAIPTAERIVVFRNTAAIGRDGVTYITHARRIEADPLGTLRTSPLHPGYELAIVAARPLFGPTGDVIAWQRAGVAAAMAFAALATLAIWALATQTLGNVVWGFWAALLYSLSRKFSWLGAEVLSDAPALACMFAGLAAGVCACRAMVGKRWRGAVGWSALAGAAAGLGYWARVESLVVVAIAGLLLLAAQLKRRPSWRVFLASGGALVVSAGLLALPYMLLIGGLTGDMKFHDFGLPGQAAATATNLLLAQIYDNSNPVALEFLGKFTEALHPILTGLVAGYFVLACLGRLGGKRLARLREVLPTPTRDATVLIVLVWLLVTPPIVMRYWRTGALSHRYLALPAGVMAPFAVAFVVALVRLVVPPAAERRRLLVQRIALLGLAAGLMAHTIQRPLHAGDMGLRLGGAALAGENRPDDVLLTNHALVAFYSNWPDYVLALDVEVRAKQEVDPNMSIARLLARKLELAEKPVTVVAWAVSDKAPLDPRVEQVLSRDGFVRAGRAPAQDKPKQDHVIFFRRAEPGEPPATAPQSQPGD